MSEVRVIVIGAALAFFAALALAPFFAVGFRKFRRQGIGFSIVMLGFLYAAATKPARISVTFDDYLADNGSHFTTNGVNYVGLSIAWVKTNQALPDAQPLYISRREKGSGGTWETFGETTVGQSPFERTSSNVTNYEYFVWHEWSPPSPVHTNGVWLGNVIEKANGNNGVDKLIIIHGQLNENGRSLLK